MAPHRLVMLWTPKKRGWRRIVHYVCSCGTVGKATTNGILGWDVRGSARYNYRQHAKRMEGR